MVTSRPLLLSLIFIFQIVLGVGCTVDNDPKVEHIGPGTIDESYNDSESILQVKSGSLEDYFEQRNVIRWEIKKSEQGANTWHQRLAPSIESLKFWARKDIKPRLRNELLDLYNLSVLELFKYPTSKDMGLQAAESIRDIIFNECEGEYKRCLALKKMGGSSLTATIMYILLDRVDLTLDKLDKNGKGLSDLGVNEAVAFVEHLRTYYRLVRIISRLHNGVKDPRFDIQLMKWAQPYLKVVKGKELKSYIATLQIAIQATSSSQKFGNTPKGYCATMVALGQKGFFTNNPALSRTVLKQGYDSFFDCAKEKNKGAFYRKTIERSKDAQLELVKKLSSQKTKSMVLSGFYFARKKLGKSELSVISYKDGQIEVNESHKALIYILDQMLTGEIGLSTATNFWQSQNLKIDSETIKVAESYFQTVTAHLSREAIRVAGNIFKNKYNVRKKIDSRLILESLNTIFTATKRPVERFKGQVSLMGNFLSVMFERNRSQMSADLYKKSNVLVKKVSNISGGLDYSISFPLKLIIDYYMSQVNSNISFELSWHDSQDRKFQISEPKKEFNDNFSDSRSRDRMYISYGGTTRTWSQAEKLLSLEWMFQLDYFSLFPLNLTKNEKSQSSGELLLEAYFNYNTLIQEQVFASVMGDINAIAINSDYRTNFLRFCRDPLSLNEETPPQYTLDIDSFSAATVFGPNDVLHGFNALFGAVDKFEAWTKTVEDLNRLHQILKKHEPTLKIWKQSDLAQQEAQVANRVQEIFKSISNESFDCMERFYHLDRFRMRAGIDMHRDHYKNVHAAMAILKVIDLDKPFVVSGVVNLVKKQFRDSGTFEEASSQDTIKRVDKTIKELGEKEVLVDGLSYDVVKSALNESLKMHNKVESSVFKGRPIEWGYKMTFANAAPGKIKNLSSFDQYRYTDFKWNAVMRTIFFLENKTVNYNHYDLSNKLGIEISDVDSEGLIAGNLKVMLPGYHSLIETELYRNEKSKHDILFNWDQNEFVQNSLVGLIGAKTDGEKFLSWISDSNKFPDKIKQIFDFKLKLFLMGGVPLNETAREHCEYNGFLLKRQPEGCESFNFSAKEVVRSFYNYVKLLNLEQWERDLLGEKGIGIYKLGTVKTIDTLRYSGLSNPGTWTVFDQFFLVNFLGKEQKPAGKPVFYIDKVETEDRFLDYKMKKRMFIDQRNHLFNVDVESVQAVRDMERKPLVKRVNRLQHLVRAVRDLEAVERDVEPIVFGWTNSSLSGEVLLDDVWRHVNIETRPSEGDSPILLKDRGGFVERFDLAVERYILYELDCDMMARPGDPDNNVEHSDLDCQSKLGYWKLDSPNFKPYSDKESVTESQ